MALRYAILGLLSAEPMSGYDLAKWMDRGLGNIWSAHASQIYPELARMVEAGVIVEVPGDTGPRRRRVYGISDDGAAGSGGDTGDARDLAGNLRQGKGLSRRTVNIPAWYRESLRASLGRLATLLTQRLRAGQS